MAKIKAKVVKGLPPFNKNFQKRLDKIGILVYNITVIKRRKEEIKMTVKQIIENIIEDYYAVLEIAYYDDEYKERLDAEYRDFREDVSKLKQIMDYDFFYNFDR